MSDQTVEPEALFESVTARMPSVALYVGKINGACAVRNGATRVHDSDSNAKGVTFDIYVDSKAHCFELVLSARDTMKEHTGGGSAKYCSGHTPSPAGKRVSAVFENTDGATIEWNLHNGEPDCKLKITIKHDT